MNSQGNVERATDWIFSHPDDGGSDDAVSSPSPSAQILCDGHGKYELVGFITHMGKNFQCGHYVCHIKKNGEWCLFNDEKVCKSENPPLEHGYIYLYRRS